MASPPTHTYTPAPFTETSPPRQRVVPQHLGQALPTSASEGALSHKPVTPLQSGPSQPTKIKPFILRSTSPASRGQQPSSPPGAGPSLNRAASVPAFGAKLKSTGPAPPLPTGKTSKTRRGDPFSSRTRPPLRSAATTDDRSRRSSIVLVQNPEQRKIEIKRSSVLLRRREGEGSGVEKGKRWLANLTGGSSLERERSAGAAMQARRKASLGDMTNGRRRAPTPPAFEASSSPPTTDLSSSSASSATIMPSNRLLRSPTKRTSLHDLTTPPRQTPATAAPLRAPGGSVSMDRARRDRYGALSRAKSADGRPHLPGASERGEEAYSSMQEMLESSGFTDVRVITPTSTIRVAPPPSSAIAIPGLALPNARPHPLASQSTSLASSVIFSDTNAFGSPSSLAPPLSLAHKTSMLSLRGLFSLWKADAAVAGEVAAAPQGDAEEEEATSETGSDDTITLERKRRFVAHTQQWVDQVSREVATLSSPTTLLHQSSSPHLSSYPPRPPTPRKSSAPDPAVNDHTVLRDPSPRRQGQRALKTLRHVVSDPEMAAAHSTTTPLVSESGYQSFALSGLAMGMGELGFHGAGDEESSEMSRREYDDVSSASEDEGPSNRRRSTGKAPTHPATQRPSTLAPPPSSSHGLKPTTSFWGTLRTKASEALMGQYGAQPRPISATAAVDSDDEVRRPPPPCTPLLLRKACSSVALNPVVTVAQEMDWEQVVRPKKSVRALK